MIAAEDMAACRAMIRTGSLSFHAASRLLPPRVRDPALALYAFCRVADDDVDETRDKAAAHLAAGAVLFFQPHRICRQRHPEPARGKGHPDVTSI